MLGAIVKSGAKSLAKDKAKSFITGKGKGKGGAIVKAGEQKPKVNPSNLMGRQVGGDTGGADIPASQQTINVTALGSDSSVGPSGGGSGGDPFLNGQNGNTLLGSILRIDVSKSSENNLYQNQLLALDFVQK